MQIIEREILSSPILAATALCLPFTDPEINGETQARSGLGHRFKVFEAGEIIEVRTKRNKFREGASIAITQVHDQDRDRLSFNVVIAALLHMANLGKKPGK